MARLNALAKSLSADSLSDGTLPETPGTPSSTSALSEEDLSTQDMASVQEELSRWKALGIMVDEDEIEDFDLVRFWQVSISLLPCHDI
jgi:hypothetical protein